MSPTKILIVVGGPTASGKTTLAIKLAKQFKTEIISADSRQFYKELSIGTAKPSIEELAEVPHHFIGHLGIAESYSVGEYERAAIQRITALFESKKVVVVVGGSGLFINVLLHGLDEFPKVLPEVRTALNEAYQKEGLPPLLEELAEKDSKYYAEVDRANPMRIIRALEVIRSSNKTFSSFRVKTKVQRDFEPILLQCYRSRDLLYDRINRRVDAMILAGLKAEVQSVVDYEEISALRTVGYQEVFDFLHGKKKWAESIGQIKQNSRRYAKRQLTWFRKHGSWIMVDPENVEESLRQVEWLQKGWKWTMKLEKSNIDNMIRHSKFEHKELGWINAALFLQKNKGQCVITAHAFQGDKAQIEQLLLQQFRQADQAPLDIWIDTELVQKFGWQAEPSESLPFWHTNPVGNFSQLLL